MTERRAVLLPLGDMYKISEEDSQDEEVRSSKASMSLSSMSNEGKNSNNGLRPGHGRVKPIPPAKPAFLRKAVTTGGVDNNINNRPVVPPKDNDDMATTTTKCASGILQTPSLSFVSVPSHKVPQQGFQGPEPKNGLADWLADNGSQSESEMSRTEETPGTGKYFAPNKTSSFREGGNQEREARRDDETSDEESSSCSSCTNGDVDGDNDEDSDENSASSSYTSTTEYSRSGGSSEDEGGFESESDSLLEEQVADFITEAEIQSLSRGDGNVLLCEYVSASNGPEILESANTKTGPSRATSIHTSTGPDTGTEAAESRKMYKGNGAKISRLLKRSRDPKGKRMRGEDRRTTDDDEASSAAKAFKPAESKLLPKASTTKVFRFKDEHQGEIRRVELLIRSFSKHNLGRRATMVESLLGILPSRFSTGAATDRANSSKSASAGKSDGEDRRIMVAGFIPDGPAARDKRIKIGDWLQRINGTSVDFSNVNSILLQATQQQGDGENLENPLLVTLELQRVSGYTITETPTKTVTFEDSVTDGSSNSRTQSEGKAAEGELSQDVMSKIAVIYISVVNTSTTSMVPKEKTKDVIFAWPKETESRKVKTLSSAHGMFSTLYKLLGDVTGSHPVISRVMIDEEETDVVFASDDDGNGLLLLAASTVLSNFNISNSLSSKGSLVRRKKLRWKDPLNGGLVLAQRLMTRVKTLLQFQFGSLSRAFRNTPDEKLHYFFTAALAGLSDISEEFLFTQVPDYFLKIPSQIRYSIDERLFHLETSDVSDLCYGKGLGANKPLFNCLGSCLYYKGMVITSHLERSVSSQMHGLWRTLLGLWCVKRHTLPFSWDPVRRLVIWQETYLHQESIKTWTESDGVMMLAEQEDLLNPKVFHCSVVLLGIGNFMLGMVLEPLTPEQGDLTADIGWIQRGINCLLRILKSDVHASLEKWILAQDKEFVELYPPKGPHNKAFSSGEKIQEYSAHQQSSGAGPSGILKNTANVDVPSSHVKPIPSPKHQEHLSKSMESLGLEGGDLRGLVHDYTYHQGLSNQSVTTERLELDRGSNNEDEDETTTGTGSDTSSLKWYIDEPRLDLTTSEDELHTLSIAKGNVLFDFLQIEHGRGVLLSSKDDVEGPLAVVVHNFRQSATLSHHILHKAANARMRLSQQMSDKKWVSKALTPISEHGVLFNCDVVDPRDIHKKKPRLRQLSYWVVGRMYPNQREVYVCYQESSVAQNLTEIAFKLAHYSM